MERRLTANKRRILNLFEETHALSVKEIKERLPDMDTSTIYRNLERFAEDGVLRIIPVESKRTYFERASCDVRAHFCCDSCHEIEPLHTHVSVPKTSLPKGARATHTDIVAHGKCKTCVS